MKISVCTPYSRTLATELLIKCDLCKRVDYKQARSPAFERIDMQTMAVTTDDVHSILPVVTTVWTLLESVVQYRASECNASSGFEHNVTL